MEYQYQLTVTEILKRPSLRHAEVIAGKRGLDRIVNWVHILEAVYEHHPLNGKELILSTGIGWAGDRETRLSFLRHLIKSNAACLCIERGVCLAEIPEDLLKTANENNFPVILLERQASFIQITKDLHAMFVNQYYYLLDSFSQKLNQYRLMANSLQNILNLLYRYTGDARVVYLPLQGEPECIPVNSSFDEKKTNALMQMISEHDKKANSTGSGMIQKEDTAIAYKMIRVVRQKWAYLAVIRTEKVITEIEMLLLDRCAAALSHEFLCKLYNVEKKRNKEQQWIYRWLKGEYEEKDILQNLKMYEPSIKPNRCVVCIAQIKMKDKDQDFNESRHIMQMSILARYMFEQQGFHFMNVFDTNQMIFILFDQKKAENYKERMGYALQRMQKTILDENMGVKTISFSVGKAVNLLSNVHKSLQTAKELLDIQKKRGGEPVYYDELHVYRILHLCDRENKLNEFVFDYLRPIIDFDKEHQGEMMKTLKVFLQCNGSKQETSERLFIVRQTLYHRLQKLEEMLGPDFMSGEKRLAIEIAVHAYDYVNPSVDF